MPTINLIYASLLLSLPNTCEEYEDANDGQAYAKRVQPTYSIDLLKTLGHRILRLTFELLTEFSPHSTDTTKITVFEHRKSLHIFCSQSCFGAA